MNLKEKYIIYISIISFLTIFENYSFAQSIIGSRTVRIQMNTVSLLDIKPNNSSITLSYNVTEAGSPITAETNNTKWLNYTSQINFGDPLRSVSVQLNSVLPGIDLRVEAANAINGRGQLGIPTGQITISTIPTILLNNIGGAFTESGINNGHQLTYSLHINDYNLLSELTNEPLIVTYTMTN